MPKLIWAPWHYYQFLNHRFYFSIIRLFHYLQQFFLFPRDVPCWIFLRAIFIYTNYSEHTYFNYVPVGLISRETWCQSITLDFLLEECKGAFSCMNVVLSVILVDLYHSRKSNSRHLTASSTLKRSIILLSTMLNHEHYFISPLLSFSYWLTVFRKKLTSSPVIRSIQCDSIFITNNYSCEINFKYLFA